MEQLSVIIAEKSGTGTKKNSDSRSTVVRLRVIGSNATAEHSTDYKATPAQPSLWAGSQRRAARIPDN